MLIMIPYHMCFHAVIVFVTNHTTLFKVGFQTKDHCSMKVHTIRDHNQQYLKSSPSDPNTKNFQKLFFLTEILYCNKHIYGDLLSKIRSEIEDFKYC